MARGNASKKQRALAAAMVDGQEPPPEPLPRGSHTAQLLFHTSVHTILLALSAFILPAHRLATRDSTPNFSSSATLGVLASLSHYFTLPASPEATAKLVKLQWGTLQALLLTQAWACIRLQRWYDLGAAIEAGDSEKAERLSGGRRAAGARRSRGIAAGLISNLGAEGFMEGLEQLTLTTLTNLPVACAAIYVTVVLLGAPVTSDITATLQLSLGVGLVVALPLLNVLPADLAEWARVVGTFSTRSPRERLLLIQTIVPLATSFLASAALSLDHGKAWLSWPVPPLVGLFAGAMLGNVVGTVDYLLR